MKKQTLFISLFLSLVLCISANAETITILHVNDTHSCLSPGGPRNKDLSGKIGGIARAATVIGMTRAEDPEALLLHAGDIAIGDLFYNKYFGVAELQLMLSLGFDAMTLGNHEFDLDPYNLTGVFDEAFAESSFPLLSANLDASDESLEKLRNYVSDYIVLEAHGVKIGVFGVTTPETNLLSDPAPASFREDLDVILPPLITKLKTEEECEIIIMLSHMGYEYDKQIVQMVPYIDVVIGGHDHIDFAQPEEVENPGGTNTLIVQTQAFYRKIGCFKIEYDEGIKSINWENIYLDESIPEEPSTKGAVDMLIAGIEETYGAVYSEQIAYAEADLAEENASLFESGRKDTPVGNLVTDAYLAFGETDIAIQPGGSTAQPFYEGPIVADDVYRVLSYGFNTDNGLGYRMVKFDITGMALMAGLEFGLSKIETNDDFFIQCAGMEYIYDSDQEAGTRLRSLKIGGEVVDPSATYSVTTNEYVPMVMEMVLMEMGHELYNVEVIEGVSEFEVLTQYVAQMQTLVPYTEGRILNREDNVSVEDEKEDSGMLEIYPNPCDEMFNVKLESDSPDNFMVKVFDLFGQPVLSASLDSINNTVNSGLFFTADLAPGHYHVEVRNGVSVFTKPLLIFK